MMWVFTRDGLYSVVRDQANPAKVMVRTRSKAMAVRFAEWVRAAQHVTTGSASSLVVETWGADYPYRVIVPHVYWTEYVREAAADIDYGNFKEEVGGPVVAGNRCTPEGRNYLDLLHSVWDTVREWETRAYGERPHGMPHVRRRAVVRGDRLDDFVPDDDSLRYNGRAVQPITGLRGVRGPVAFAVMDEGTDLGPRGSGAGLGHALARAIGDAVAEDRRHRAAKRKPKPRKRPKAVRRVLRTAKASRKLKGHGRAKRRK